MALFKHSMRESVQEHGGRTPKTSRTERSYRRFFEGYTPETVVRTGKDGRSRGYQTNYVYTGDTFRQDLSDRKRTGVRCLYVLCWLAGSVLLGFAATRVVPANTVWYVTVFQAAAFLGLLWMVPALIYYVSSPREMTLYTYRTMIGFHFRVSRWVAFVALALAFLGSLVNLLLDRSGGWGLRIAVSAMLLVSALLIGCICRVEPRITYIRKEGAKEQ